MKNKTMILIVIISLAWSVLLNFVLVHEKKKRDIIVDNTKTLIDHYEKEINRLVNYYENKDYISTDTIQWSVIVDDWKFTNNGTKYISKKDTVFVVNLDSIQSLYKYYRIALDPPSYAINLMTVCYGDYDNWKKRTVNGITQYSLDGTNWFEL